MKFRAALQPQGRFSTEDIAPSPGPLKEPIPAGPMRGSMRRLGEMLPKYHELRRWNKKGMSTEEKLKELKLA